MGDVDFVSPLVTLKVSFTDAVSLLQQSEEYGLFNWYYWVAVGLPPSHMPVFLNQE